MLNLNFIRNFKVGQKVGQKGVLFCKKYISVKIEGSDKILKLNSHIRYNTFVPNIN